MPTPTRQRPRATRFVRPAALLVAFGLVGPVGAAAGTVVGPERPDTVASRSVTPDTGSGAPSGSAVTQGESGHQAFRVGPAGAASPSVTGDPAPEAAAPVTAQTAGPAGSPAGAGVAGATPQAAPAPEGGFWIGKQRGIRGAAATQDGVAPAPASSEPAPAPAVPTPGPAAPQPVSPDVRQMSYFYRPPADGDTGSIARNYGHIVLTQLDEPIRDRIRAAGYRGDFYQYIRFEAIMDDTGLGYQWHNQVAFRPGDWEMISKQHPDWFLLDRDGNRIRAHTSGDDAETRFYLMDPANPGWRAFFLARVRQMQQDGRWDGLFLDNVELSLGKRTRSGQIPARYPTDEAYVAAVEDMLRWVRANTTGTPLEANLIEKQHDRDPNWSRMMRHVDRGFYEGWAIGWDDSRLLPAWSWNEQLKEAEQTIASGKPVTLVAMGERGNTARQQFAYASFLLIADGRSSFRYTNSATYDQDWQYANYGQDLGRPLGARYQVGDTWRRDFERGAVVVNPATGTVSIG